MQNVLEYLQNLSSTHEKQPSMHVLPSQNHALSLFACAQKIGTLKRISIA